MKDFLTGLFAALWLLDTAAAVSFVQQFGVDMEVNPFMHLLILKTGLQGFVICKAAILVFWVTLQRHAHVAIHWGLVLIMVPIVYMSLQLAWG